MSRLRRLAQCGRIPVGTGDGSPARVTIKDHLGVAHYSGLSTCGSTWACPVCEPKIANARALEISRAAAGWDRAGNSVFMVTFTASHALGMLLSALIMLISSAFRFTISGRPWRTLKDAVGIVGTIRSMEVTHGLNGWHPHLHVLVFVRGDPGPGG